MWSKYFNMILHRLFSRKWIAKRAVRPLAQFHSEAYKYLSYAAVHAEETSLHPKHRLTRYHDFFIQNVNPEDSVLDVGCGNGALSADLAKKAKKVIGIDMNHTNVERAKRKYGANNLIFVEGDATKDGFYKHCEANVIVMSNLLEHVKERKKLLLALKKIAGKFLIRVPQYDRAWEVLYKKELGLEWRLDPTHETEYTQEQLEKELQDAGLKIKTMNLRFGEFWVVAERS